jgi:hypothetical protein
VLLPLSGQLVVLVEAAHGGDVLLLCLCAQTGLAAGVKYEWYHMKLGVLQKR